MFANNSKFSLANTIKFGYSYKYLEKKKNSLIRMSTTNKSGLNNQSLNLSGVLDVSGTRFLNK